MQQYRHWWKRCHLLGPCEGVIRRTIEGRIVQLEESPLSERTEHGRRGIAVVRSRYQKTSSQGTADWKRLSIIL
jgi:hypothetical protein